ncbi:MAG: hypothetical protein OHK0013_13690 [Sandaracinaceae bacterium]
MLSVDLTTPIVVLCVAVFIVLAVRGYAAWAERAIDARTDTLLARFGQTGARERERVRENDEAPVAADELRDPDPRA